MINNIQIKSGSFSDMADEIRLNNKKIVIFGSGAIGAVVTLEILTFYHLENHIECYLDNDSGRWGEDVQHKCGKWKIYSPSYLEELGDKVVILMTISRCTNVIRQLESMDCIKDTACYVIPIMLMTNFHRNGGRGVVKESQKQLIPKKIHYMWLGGKALPHHLQRCIDSWERLCPDYEIIRWDESNYDIGKNLYMRQAYDEGAFAFVPDYARLDILYHHGGIYMDTDVEVIRNLDDLLYQQAFCSVEKWQVVNFGGCNGAVKGHKSLKAFLQEREQLEFIKKDGSYNKKASGFYDTRVIMRHGYKMNGENQNIMGMNIYTYDYFHSYDYMSGRTEMTDDTYAIHHLNGSWINEDDKFLNEKQSREFEELYKRTLV